MHNAYRGGTPDVYYSGMKDDLWVEYKWQTVPKKGLLVPKLSPLQMDWLKGRYTEGRKVVCCVGTRKGALWLDLPHEWEGVSFGRIGPLDDDEVAAVIRSICS